MRTTRAFGIAQPFPHVVTDHFIDAGTVRAINEEWPEGPWSQYRHGRSNKRACAISSVMGPATAELLSRLNGAEFLGNLQVLTGIPDLTADPLLSGGGLHETMPGGFLKVHADFNLHPETRLTRRVNLLLYLNENWQEDWSGQLELWDRDRCHVRIAPLAGRCVIFETGATSFHGHPAPLACPHGRTRRSIALYYYSPGDSASVEHSTLYLGDEANWPAGLR